MLDKTASACPHLMESDSRTSLEMAKLYISAGEHKKALRRLGRWYSSIPPYYLLRRAEASLLMSINLTLMERFQEGHTRLVPAFASREALLGKDSVRVVEILYPMAQCQRGMKQNARYYELLDRCASTIMITERTCSTVKLQEQVAFELMDLKQYNSAKRLFHSAVKTMQAMADCPHPLLAMAMYNLGVTCDCMGESEEAIKWIEAAVSSLKKGPAGMKTGLPCA